MLNFKPVAGILLATVITLSACGGGSTSPSSNPGNNTAAGTANGAADNSGNGNTGENGGSGGGDGGGNNGGTPIDVSQCLAQPVRNDQFTIKPVNLAANIDMDIKNILPPGQSGHFPSVAACPITNPNCFLADNAPDSYGPHIDDQRLMFWRSEFKPGEFLDVSALTPAVTLNITSPAVDEIKIYRDPFGVPAVHANTEFGVWYGAGYALTEDRLFLVDQAIRLARGTSGEVLGAGSVGADVQTRTLTYSEAEYAAIEAGLSERAKTALAGHVAGINARIDDVNNDPSMALLPQEFVTLRYTPSHISTADILALGVLMTRFVASAGGDEMVNVAALQALVNQHGDATGKQLFQDILWIDDKKGDVTIPDNEFTNISTPLAARQQVFEAQANYALSLPLELANGPGTGAFTVAMEMGPPKPFKLNGKEMTTEQMIAAVNTAEKLRQRPDHTQASYMMVASPDITADGSTLLVNGPQLGYSYPSLLVELEVHGAGYDARGATVAGLPVVGIGYGERTVWGLTTGESKTIDSFIVEVTSQDGKQYRHDGQVKTMDCRNERVDYRTAAGPLPNVSEPEPGANSVTIEVCRTVHGPVVARSNDGTLARAVQYGMWMREIDTVEGVLQWNRVDTFSEFNEAMSKVTWNENLMYADADGNIAYYHPGLHPWRHPSTDQRLPNKGDGSQDHCDTLTFANTPKSINPTRGYLHNWNNKPSTGWGDGVSGDASQEPAGADGRNVNWGLQVEAQLQGDGLTHSDLVEMDKRIGRVDPKAEALLAPILACDGGCQLNASEQALIDILKTWDKQHYNDAIDIEAAEDSEAAKDTPAATIFGEIVQAMVDDITGGVIPADFIARHERRGNHPYDAGTFHKLLAKLLNPSKSSIPATFDWLRNRSNDQFVKDAIAVALGRMQATYGSTDPNSFKRMHARAEVCALANPLAGPCGTMPHQDRGSWLKIVGFKPQMANP